MPKIIEDDSESTSKPKTGKTSSKTKTAVLERPRGSNVASLVGDLLSWIRPVPADWVVEVSDSGIAQEISSKPCTNYKTLVLAWRKAMRWRQDMDDVLATMLAVVASTVQQGDQLFLMVIGDAGCIGEDTPIYDPVTGKTLTVGERYKLKEAFHVWAKAKTGETVIALALAPNKFPETQMYEVELSNGSTIKVTGNHRFRAIDGSYISTSQIPSSQNLLLSMLEPCPLEFREDGQHSKHIVEDYPSPYDELLHCRSNTYEESDGSPMAISSGVTVIRITKIGIEPYFDFAVPEYHNYEACGVFHHNSGKTRFCEGLLVSKHCHALEYLTGFFSGITDSSGNDYSLINRVNRKCMITPEGDVMLKNPNSLQIFAESRRIFDGTISASFKTKLEDKKYTGLRTPWIMAGTPAMLENDQASLGDRFLKIYLDSPSNSERREILQRISRSAMEAVKNEAEGEEVVGEKLLEAYRLTGGYVDWLRDNTELLKHISVEEQYLEQCEYFAELAAFLRARPSDEDGGRDCKEEPNRLNHQLVRAMCTLTLVLNKESVDEDVMRRIKKLALDTGKGIVLNVIECINRNQNQFVTLKSAALQLEIEEAKLRKIFKFLKNIGVIKLSAEEGVRRGTKPLWGFTPLMKELVDEVLNKE